MSTISIDYSKQYTFADYLTWIDGKRYELLNGLVKLMSPAPARRHQKISTLLSRFFINYLFKKKCEVYYAPFDVRLPQTKVDISDNKIYTVVQPDICIICDPSKLDDKGCIGAPDLIVEIISKSSAHTDTIEKFAIYEKAGVKEYWLLHPEEQTLTVFLLDENNKYSQARIYGPQSKVIPSIFPDLEIDLSDVFENQ